MYRRGGRASLPTSKPTPGTDMSLLDAVREALDGEPGMRWQREMALGMAAELDEKQNASMSNALRALMEDIGASTAERKGDVSDDLAAKRAARRQAAG